MTLTLKKHNNFCRTEIGKSGERYEPIRFQDWLPCPLGKKIESVTSVRSAQSEVTDFDSEKKRMENFTDFETLTHVIGHDLQGFTVKK